MRVPVGKGSTIKLAVNGLFCIQLGAIAELLGLLRNTGIDLQTAFDIIDSTPVCSSAGKMAGDAMISAQFALVFPITLVEKDFVYIESTADVLGVKMPLASVTRRVLQRAIGEGFAGDNITGIAQLYFSSAEWP